MTAPKVFVSHASEDKARFVVDFARRLRENGVEAWLDQWEMKPGDSQVGWARLCAHAVSINPIPACPDRSCSRPRPRPP
ncbi:MAG: toll/interleukin-1 receptor domain-containing protein [Sulfuricella sp.]